MPTATWVTSWGCGFGLRFGDGGGVAISGFALFGGTAYDELGL